MSAASPETRTALCWVQSGLGSAQPRAEAAAPSWAARLRWGPRSGGRASASLRRDAHRHFSRDRGTQTDPFHSAPRLGACWAAWAPRGTRVSVEAAGPRPALHSVCLGPRCSAAAVPEAVWCQEAPSCLWVQLQALGFLWAEAAVRTGKLRVRVQQRKLLGAHPVHADCRRPTDLVALGLPRPTSNLHTGGLQPPPPHGTRLPLRRRGRPGHRRQFTLGRASGICRRRSR